MGAGGGIVNLPHWPLEVRRNADGSLDEIVWSGHFHLEQMDHDVWWMALYDRNGGRQIVTLYRKGKDILAHAEYEENIALKSKRKKAT